MSDDVGSALIWDDSLLVDYVTVTASCSLGHDIVLISS